MSLARNSACARRFARTRGPSTGSSTPLSERLWTAITVSAVGEPDGPWIVARRTSGGRSLRGSVDPVDRVDVGRRLALLDDVDGRHPRALDQEPDVDAAHVVAFDQVSLVFRVRVTRGQRVVVDLAASACSVVTGSRPPPGRGCRARAGRSRTRSDVLCRRRWKAVGGEDRLRDQRIVERRRTGAAR